MPFTIDFLDDGRVLEWDATDDDAVATKHNDYTPRFYVGARDLDADIDITALQSIYDHHPGVVATEMVTQHSGFRRDEESVLAVDVGHIDRATSLAQQARQLTTYPVGDLACFNVDFSREFRYCLEEDVDPTPASELSTLRLSVPVTEMDTDMYTELSVAGDTVSGPPTDILTAVQAALEDQNPDILVCSTSEIIPTLYEMAAAADVDEFTLSRWPDVDNDAREDLQALVTEITEDVEIRLEHEAHCDWVAFVPQRESDAGALTKYFGKVAGSDEFKLRGIEARQRSTPSFIEDV